MALGCRPQGTRGAQAELSPQLNLPLPAGERQSRLETSPRGDPGSFSPVPISVSFQIHRIFPLIKNISEDIRPPVCREGLPVCPQTGLKGETILRHCRSESEKM